MRSSFLSPSPSTSLPEFAMYLNRARMLEAWDIEQELRRALQT